MSASPSSAAIRARTFKMRAGTFDGWRRRASTSSLASANSFSSPASSAASSACFFCVSSRHSGQVSTSRRAAVVISAKAEGVAGNCHSSCLQADWATAHFRNRVSRSSSTLRFSPCKSSMCWPPACQRWRCRSSRAALQFSQSACLLCSSALLAADSVSSSSIRS